MLLGNLQDSSLQVEHGCFHVLLILFIVLILTANQSEVSFKLERVTPRTDIVNCKCNEKNVLACLSKHFLLESSVSDLKKCHKIILAIYLPQQQIDLFVHKKNFNNDLNHQNINCYI